MYLPCMSASCRNVTSDIFMQIHPTSAFAFPLRPFSVFLSGIKWKWKLSTFPLFLSHPPTFFVFFQNLMAFRDWNLPPKLSSSRNQVEDPPRIPIRLSFRPREQEIRISAKESVRSSQMMDVNVFFLFNNGIVGMSKNPFHSRAFSRSPGRV